jgi:hypothetical protein
METPPEQLELKIAEVKLPEKPSRRSSASSPASLGPRLAVSPDEAAALLGVSRDYFDEHVIDELRIVVEADGYSSRSPSSSAGSIEPRRCEVRSIGGGRWPMPERIDRAARAFLPARRSLRKTRRRVGSARPVSAVPEHGPRRYRLPVVDRRSLKQASLPGAELVEKGLSDLANRMETVESLLVSIGSPRLRRLGFDVQAPVDDAEERLYLLLAREDPQGAHSRYNALVRRLVSFERAAESAR